MYVSFIDMLNCPSVSAGFKKYDISSFCRDAPSRDSTQCIQWLGEGLKNKKKTKLMSRRNEQDFSTVSKMTLEYIDMKFPVY